MLCRLERAKNACWSIKVDIGLTIQTILMSLAEDNQNKPIHWVNWGRLQYNEFGWGLTLIFQSNEVVKDSTMQTNRMS